ncbi:MAG: oligosaccharide flippase family protein [Rhodospirillaceae bacterium]
MTGTGGTLDRKFVGDTAWNYGAFALMAATGVILNFFIAWHFGTAALGVFNQIYAVYVVAAQLAVFGVHDSAQKHVAEFAGDRAETRAIAQTAVTLAAVIGGAVAFVLWAAAGVVGTLADSVPVGKGVALAAPGLMPFAINKVLLGVLNGERRMRAFAVVQGMRVLSILGLALLVALRDRPAYELGAAFSVAEAVILVPLLFLVRPWQPGGRAVRVTRQWIGRHLDFGTRALPNGFLAESYIRVDVLMLALFVDDAAVGVYSFAAMFIEGLYQVPTVVRTVVNPMLVKLVATADRVALGRFARRVMAASLAIFVVTAGIVHVAFPYLAPWFADGLVVGAREVLIPLTIGLGLYAAFVPLDFILMQAGQPGRQSALMTANITVNVLLNLALIPSYGIMGAALATAAAFAFSAVTLNAAAWRWLGMPGGLVFGGR